MAKVYLFNLQGEKRRRVRLLLIRLGIPAVEILPRDFNRTLGALSGREGYADMDEETLEPFTDEMLVMDDLSPDRFHALVDGLRQMRAVIPLKAVVTEHNLRWSPARLHRELRAEYEAMQAERKSVHGEQNPKK